MTGPLITGSELRARLPEVTVLDVRYRMDGPSGPEEHVAGHVPGAAYVDLDRDLAGSPGGGGRHPLPEADDFEAAMRRAGVRDDRPVVVYDDWSARAAGRCWWLLRHHGHRDVRVLDGGWSAWVADGGAVGTGPVDPVRGDFAVTPVPVTEVVDASGVLYVDVLIDARAPERHRGESEPVDPVAGHVPGAVNVPTGANLGADGRFRGPDELRALYAEVGAVPGADVAVYCGSGVTATHDLLALEVAGVAARLFPGSWSGWITDPDRPFDRGDGVVVRPATTADVPALVALAEAVWPVAYDFDPAYAAHTIATWWSPEALTRSQSTTSWVVAEAGGIVLGGGNVDLRQDTPTIWCLAVLPDQQGRGVGTSLLGALARRAEGSGVRLSYLTDNTRAGAFYASLGFVEVGREPASDVGPEHVVVERGPA